MAENPVIRLFTITLRKSSQGYMPLQFAAHASLTRRPSYAADLTKRSVWHNPQNDIDFRPRGHIARSAVCERAVE